MRQESWTAERPTPALRSQADQAYHRLEEAIVTLEIPPGSTLSEARAIEISGLGRTPVREALLKLAQHGLISIVPRKGMEVRPVDPVDLLNVLDIRQVLERAMICSAALRGSVAERGELLRHAQNMVHAAVAGDLVTYMQNDKLFHDVIASAAHNPYGVRALEPLQTFMRRAWYVFKRGNNDVVPAARQHLALAQAIAVSDPATAAKLCDDWMEHMRKELHEEIGRDGALGAGTSRQD